VTDQDHDQDASFASRQSLVPHPRTMADTSSPAVARTTPTLLQKLLSRLFGSSITREEQTTPTGLKALCIGELDMERMPRVGQRAYHDLAVRRVHIGACMCFTTVVSAMAAQAVLLALPSIGKDLNIPDVSLQWLQSAYALTFVRLAPRSVLLVCCDHAALTVPDPEVQSGLFVVVGGQVGGHLR
jgi:hypothetical protein